MLVKVHQTVNQTNTLNTISKSNEHAACCVNFITAFNHQTVNNGNTVGKTITRWDTIDEIAMQIIGGRRCVQTSPATSKENKLVQTRFYVAKIVQIKVVAWWTFDTLKVC